MALNEPEIFSVKLLESTIMEYVTSSCLDVIISEYRILLIILS